MTQYKQFRYPDPDPKWADDREMDDVYSVLGPVVSAMGSTRYISNPDERFNSFEVYPEEIDHYIEIFQYIKQKETTNNE